MPPRRPGRGSLRGILVVAAVVAMGIAGLIIAKLIAPTVRTQTPVFDGPAGAVIHLDKMGGPEYLIPERRPISGALLGVFEHAASFRLSGGGTARVLPEARIRWYGTPSSSALDVEQGRAQLEISPQTVPTEVRTPAGWWRTRSASFTVEVFGTAEAARAALEAAGLAGALPPLEIRPGLTHVTIESGDLELWREDETTEIAEGHEAWSDPAGHVHQRSSAPGQQGSKPQMDADERR